MDKRNRKPFVVQEVQEKTCNKCNQKAVFVEMKKLYCPNHYAKLKHIPLEDHEQRLTTNTDI